MSKPKSGSRPAAGIVLAALLCVMSSARAETPDQLPGAEELIARWSEANGFCRGRSGDDPETWAWCGVRDAIDGVLTVRGYCYGKEGQAAIAMEWHECTKGSIPGVPPKNPYD